MAKLAILSGFFVTVCLSLLVDSSQAACSKGTCQVRDVCSSDSDCESGLFCSSCAADGDSTNRCHRYQATNIIDIKGGMPFNKYAWLTTHNSFAIVGEPSSTGQPRVTFSNQEDSVTDQLNNGVRGFMLDMYDFRGDIWLCHSYGGVCYDYTAFEPANKTLQEIEAFLSANPTEIVTIFIEDYVTSPNGLSNLFKSTGLMKYWFPVASMPKNGEDWPTVTELVSKNYRLIVFTSKSSKEASEGIAYNWNYVNENQYGNGGLEPGKCPSRGESKPLNDNSRSLVLVNFFPDDPVQSDACQYNSASLQQMLPVCYDAAGKRWANFIAVDFYKRSDGGGVFSALDSINSQFICGCSNIESCKLKMPYGVCNATTSPSTSQTSSIGTSASASASVTTSRSRPNTNSGGYDAKSQLQHVLACALTFLCILKFL